MSSRAMRVEDRRRAPDDHDEHRDDDRRHREAPLGGGAIGGDLLHSARLRGAVTMVVR